MDKIFKNNKWTLFLFLAVGLTSCNGQVKINSPKDYDSVSKTITDKQPKLIKTQGSQPGDNVHCSLQDKSGNLWFGTTGEGVYKFDGKSFKQYTESDGLKSNCVFDIFESNDGEIWIGTDNGLTIYDGKSFTNITIAPIVNSNHNKFYVFSIMQDKSGKIWVATVEGVYSYDGKSFSSLTVNEEKDLPS